MRKKRDHARANATAPAWAASPGVASCAALLSFLEKHARAIAIAAVLFASARIIATYTVFNHTADEPAHIGAGMEWLDKGRYTWEPAHTPLPRVAMALGPYLLGIRSQNQDRSVPGAMTFEGLKILYAGHHYDLTLAMARLGILPFFWVACLVVYEWGRRYYNKVAAVLAVAFFTFLPPILAHAGLATSDMPVTAFMGAVFLTGLMWIDEPTPARAALFGLAGGLAILSKLSCLVFFPVSVALAVIGYLATKRPSMGDVLRDARRRMPTLACVAVVAFLVIWAGYRFSFGPVPFGHLKLPFPEFYAGIDAVGKHNSGGQPAYLLGHRGSQGWWHFFPVALAVKTPLAFLILVGAWIVLTVRRQFAFDRGWIPLAFAAGIMGPSMTSSIDIGVRQILPIYIGLSLMAAAAAFWIMERPFANRWPVAALALLAAWFAGSSVLSHPDYLPYFNELAGDHPERILIDSDLDWGQDIKRLSKRLKEVGAQEVYLDTLLVADFEKEHGIPREITQLDVARPPTGWVAIGFTYWKQNRLGLFDRYPQLTLWPDVTPPLERVGKSMLLWYFPPGPRN